MATEIFLVAAVDVLWWMSLIIVELAHTDPPRLKKQSSHFLFSNQSCAEASCFCLSNCGVLLYWLFVWCIQSERSFQPASCVCLSPQNTTDSSSNSSQKLESSLQPLESSPLPQRHKCMLGHRHDLHDPYRLSDHYFLDQVRHAGPGALKPFLRNVCCDF